MFYLIAFIITFIGYLITLYTVELLKKSDIPKYNLESFKDFFKRTPDIIFSTKFSYIPHRKLITVEKKKNYGELDLFFYYHEYGHFLDDKGKRMFIFLIIESINRFILLPLSVIGVVLNINYLNTIKNIVFICSLLRIYFLLKYERSASNHSIKILNIELNIIDRNIMKFSTLALFSQVLESIALFLLILLFNFIIQI